MKTLRNALIIVALALIAAGCGGSNNTASNTGGTGTSGGGGGTLVFGSAADPVALDGILVSDGESSRVIEQIFESHAENRLSLQVAVQLALVARFFERVGDHAVNIAHASARPCISARVSASGSLASAETRMPWM